MREEGPLPFARICDILGAVLAALGEAHALGVIHRDLKPENVIIERLRTGYDLVKVVDFGLAKLLGAAATVDSSVTSPGLVCGTPDYMSPEQGRGLPLDGRGDLYAVGVMLFELLTEQLPYIADTPTNVVLRHIQDPIPDRARGRARAPHPERAVRRGRARAGQVARPPLSDRARDGRRAARARSKSCSRARARSRVRRAACARPAPSASAASAARRCRRTRRRPRGRACRCRRAWPWRCTIRRPSSSRATASSNDLSVLRDEASRQADLRVRDRRTRHRQDAAARRGRRSRGGGGRLDRRRRPARQRRVRSRITRSAR